MKQPLLLLEILLHLIRLPYSSPYQNCPLCPAAAAVVIVVVVIVVVVVELVVAVAEFVVVVVAVAGPKEFDEHRLDCTVQGPDH